MKKASTKATRHRERGRPKGYNRTEIPWERIDRFLVYGELVLSDATGQRTHRYPSYQDLADRYRCSKTLIGNYARTHNCMARRKRAQHNGDEQPVDRVDETSRIGPVQDPDDPPTILPRQGPRLSIQDNLNIVDTCLREFARALDEGRFRCDTPGDLKLLLQLRDKLDEDHTQSTAEPEITLAQIQARHRELMEQMADFDPWLTGEVDERNEHGPA